MTPLRISVLGSGSVGLAFAASHALAGQQVTLLARGDALAQLRGQGIRVTGVCGEHLVPAQHLKVSDAARPDADDVGADILVVATKAYQAAPALQGVLQAAGPAAVPKSVLLLQNGWGSADEARAVLTPHVPIYSSIMMIGIERRSATHVNVNVQASAIRVGSLFGADPSAMKDAVACGQAGFLPIAYDDAIEPAILDKFLFNTCLNAIGAITRMSYGELVSNGSARQLITQVADETIRVVREERRLALAPDGPTYVERTLTPFVLPRAAAHRSSMLQDVEAGRRTEIDYLNGAVVRLGQRHGIATPANDAVACLVRARQV